MRAMPTLTYDAQAFILDGQRLHLNAVALPYAQIPAANWPRELDRAQVEGFNTILIPCDWAQHEPAPKAFFFDDQLDLRAFLRLIDERNLFAILRPGPAPHHPAWLIEQLNANPNAHLREANEPYLQAVDRYIRAIFEQAKDFQATARDVPGPILLVQLDHQWNCANTAAGDLYFDRLKKIFRGHGCDVPMLINNQLMLPVDGTIDTWAQAESPLADLRQLATLVPDAPRLLIESPVEDCKHQQHRLLQTLAAGGQFILDPAPCATAPLPTARFASAFASVLANLDPAPHAVVNPDPQAANTSLIHRTGPRGDVLFAFRGEAQKQQTLSALLPQGLTIPLHFGEDLAIWALLNHDLDSQHRLDFTNLRPLRYDHHTLVLYGPAESSGLVSINDTLLELTVPEAKSSEPLRERLFEIDLIVLNPQQLAHAHCTDEGVEIARPSRRSSPKLTGWQTAPCSALTDPQTAPPIDPPGQLAASPQPPQLPGVFHLHAAKPITGQLIAPQAADTTHVFQNGQPLASAAASEPFAVKDQQAFSFITPPAADQPVGLPLGLFQATKLPKPSIKSAASDAPDLFEIRGFLPNRAPARPLEAQTLCFSVRLSVKQPVLLQINPELNLDALLVANDQPVDILLANPDTPHQVFLNPRVAPFRSGQNNLQLQLTQPLPKSIKPQALIQLLALDPAPTNHKAQWRFAPLLHPEDADWKTPQPNRSPADEPAWWRAQFNAQSHTPDLRLKLPSHGYAWLNQILLGRFTPDAPLHLSRSLFLDGSPNQLTWLQLQGPLQPSEIKLALA